MIVAVASYRVGGPDLKFFNQVRELLSKEIASDSSFTLGVSCVTLARNIQISRALEKCTSNDLVLLLDDDIVFTSNVIEELIKESKLNNCPISARYCDIDGNPCYGVRNFNNSEITVAGLGCIVIPAKQLIEIGENFPRFQFGNSPELFGCYTECGVVEGHWYSEDHMLCARLGNVKISSLCVGHRKEIELWPSNNTTQPNYIGD